MLPLVAHVNICDNLYDGFGEMPDIREEPRKVQTLNEETMKPSTLQIDALAVLSEISFWSYL